MVASELGVPIGLMILGGCLVGSVTVAVGLTQGACGFDEVGDDG